MIDHNALIKDLASCLASATNLIAGGLNQHSDNLPIDTNIEYNKDIKRDLLIAYSGGPDSTALLLAVKAIAPTFNFSVQACHINHGLRGTQSDADATFCANICSQFDIQCKTIQLPLKKTNQHVSENTLRQMRYEQLQRFAHEQSIAFILTGHTLDDQSETVLFNLFRGTALSGLTGIKHCRRLDNRTYLIRPLLNISKMQCDRFLTEQGIVARQDLSNFNQTYTRNYIRHTILPAIKERFPNCSQHIRSMQQILTDEDALLTDLSQRLINRLESMDDNSWPLKILYSEPLALQRRSIAHALQKRSVATSYIRIQKILALNENDSLNLDKNWRVKRQQHQLLWQQIGKSNEALYIDPITVKIPGLNPVLPLGMVLSVQPYAQESHSIADHIWVDLTQIKPPLILRLRQPGDWIKPLGMDKTVKLKKYLHTHKNIKASIEHTNTPILLADQEEVLWLPGGGFSEKIKVKSTPSHSLQWLKLSDF